MSYSLIIFPTPLDAHCELRHDSGFTVVGVPALHPTGRPGQAFAIPDGTPNGHGARIVITAPKKVSLDQRGIVYLNMPGFAYPWTPGQTAAFAADDFVLQASHTTLPPLVVQGQFLAQDVP